MEKHPIEAIMSTTMENIRDMIDVNTVIGEPVVTTNGATVIPVSRVSFGFIAGGGDYQMPEGDKPSAGGSASSAGGSAQAGASQGGAGQPANLPFAGGTGAGVTVQPMGFLVIQNDQVRMMPAQHYAPIDRIIDMVPQLVDDIKNRMKKPEPLPPS